MKYDLDTLRGDVLGGVVSMVVALPTSLGFGIASGMGAAAGLYGAIAVGFFAALFGGTRGLISTPTAPIAVAMAVIIASHAETLTEAFTIVLMAGLFQILLGLSRVGRFVAYTPHVVVSGFMSGIGIIIMITQALPFLGAATASGGARGALLALPEALGNVDVNAFTIATVTLGIACLWPKRLARYVPPVLAALIGGSLLGVFWLQGTPVIGEVPAGLPALQLELASFGFILSALEPALILALLGCVDTLLTALVADSLTGRRHNPDRELVGQGIGNMVAGLFGALPGSGATVGTVTNIRSGGSTALAGVLSALLLLGLVLGLGSFVEPIPLAALAGVLVKVGWDIVDWRLLGRVHYLLREHRIIMLLTLLLTVFVDLITAVAIGLIAGAMALARQLEGLELDQVLSVPVLNKKFFAGESQLESEDIYAAQVGMVSLKGSFTVASSNKLATVIGADIREHEVVIFDFSETTHIDDSAAMLLAQLIELAGRSQTECIVVGLGGDVARTIRALDVLRDVPEDRIVDTQDGARTIAAELLTAA